MKTSTSDKTVGTIHDGKGKSKDVAGKPTDNPKLKAKGTVEKQAGKAQSKDSQAKKVSGTK